MMMMMVMGLSTCLMTSQMTLGNKPIVTLTVLGIIKMDFLSMLEKTSTQTVMALVTGLTMMMMAMALPIRSMYSRSIVMSRGIQMVMASAMLLIQMMTMMALLMQKTAFQKMHRKR